MKIRIKRNRRIVMAALVALLAIFVAGYFMTVWEYVYDLTTCDEVCPAEVGGLEISYCSCPAGCVTPEFDFVNVGETCNEACVPTDDCAQKVCEYVGVWRVYCYDECGVRQSLYDTCEIDEGCKFGVCFEKPCVPTDDCAERKCYDGNVWCYDDCGEISVKWDTCGSGEKCSQGECVPEVCTPTDDCVELRCSGGDLYCYDDCGDRRAKAKECGAYACEDGACAGGEWWDFLFVEYWGFPVWMWLVGAVIMFILFALFGIVAIVVSMFVGRSRSKRRRTK